MVVGNGQNQDQTKTTGKDLNSSTVDLVVVGDGQNQDQTKTTGKDLNSSSRPGGGWQRSEPGSNKDHR